MKQKWRLISITSDCKISPGAFAGRWHFQMFNSALYNSNKFLEARHSLRLGQGDIYAFTMNSLVQGHLTVTMYLSRVYTRSGLARIENGDRRLASPPRFNGFSC
jgi:hypothetical protein